MHADPLIDQLNDEQHTQQQLLQRANAGDDAAWVALVRLHQEAVFRLAWLILVDADDAEDVAQETFVHAWKALHRFDVTRPLRPWLLQIARNLASNRRRSVRRSWKALQRLLQSEQVTTPQTAMQSSTDADALWRSVRRLNQDDQQIIYLRIFLDLSIEESAQSLGVANGTVKSRLNRALQRLRSVAQQEFPELAQEQSVREDAHVDG